MNIIQQYLLAQLVQQVHVLGLQTAAEAAAGAARQHSGQLVVVHLEEILKLDTAEGKLAERCASCLRSVRSDRPPTSSR